MWKTWSVIWSNIKNIEVAYYLNTYTTLGIIQSFSALSSIFRFFFAPNCCNCRYIESKEEYWYPAPMIVTRDVEDMNRLKFSVWLTHRMNHQDMGERWVRRSLLVEEMIKVFHELNIEYRMLPFDMNVRHLPSLVSNRLPSNWTTCASWCRDWLEAFRLYWYTISDLTYLWSPTGKHMD